MQVCLVSTMTYISLNINTFDEYLKTKRTYVAALSPPPPVYAMRTHRPTPPSPSVRTYFMDSPKQQCMCLHRIFFKF